MVLVALVARRHLSRALSLWTSLEISSNIQIERTNRISLDYPVIKLGRSRRALVMSFMVMVIIVKASSNL